jgi:dipicolinate synthase subunit A
MVFAVMGGDERQSRLASQLARDGHEVRVFALEVAVLPNQIEHSEGAAEATRGADCVILPLPVSVKRGYLNAPLSTEAHCLGEVFGSLSPGTPVCAGMPDADTRSLARSSSAELYDYYAREELLVQNAVATAEGAIGVLLKETAETIWGRRILLIGWGHIGKALAPRLRALGAEVLVSARNAGDLAWIAAEGFTPLDTRALGGCLDDVDIVVNTVPARILGMQLLSELPGGALVVDLASRPGGVDQEAARVLGLRTLWAQGLPGKWAPETAAAAIREAVYNILGERE